MSNDYRVSCCDLTVQSVPSYECCFGMGAGSGQDADTASNRGHLDGSSQNGAAPPLQELLERVKREPTISAAATPEVAYANSVSSERQRGHEASDRADSGSSSSTGGDRNSSHQSATTSSSRPAERRSSGVNGHVDSNRRQNGAVSSGDSIDASRPSPDPGNINRRSTFDSLKGGAHVAYMNTRMSVLPAAQPYRS